MAGGWQIFTGNFALEGGIHRESVKTNINNGKNCEFNQNGDKEEKFRS